jgi:hypothetical protein
VRETLAAGRPPEAEDFPAAVQRPGRQLDPRLHRRLGAVENDRLLRQPFDGGLRVDPQVHRLRRAPAAGTIPLAGTRCRQLRVRAGPREQRDVETVTAGNATRRMQDDRLADCRPLRIERLLHAQRPEVFATGEQRSLAAAFEAERQARRPARPCRVLDRPRGAGRKPHARAQSAHSPPSAKRMAAKGGCATAASSSRTASKSHWPSWFSKTSSRRRSGSTSQACFTPCAA